MTIQWDNAWNVGNAEIDKQHQQWIDIYNRHEDAFLNNSHPNMHAMQRETLEQMIDYADYHFKAEEKYMKETSYPEVMRHWRLHKDFKWVLIERLRSLGEEGSILNSDLLLLMRNWIERHILVEDRKFVVFLESHVLPVSYVSASSTTVGG